MTFEELLELVGRTLGEAGIPYMVTGSFASSMLGMPRTTRDLDVVVDPSKAPSNGSIPCPMGVVPCATNSSHPATPWF